MKKTFYLVLLLIVITIIPTTIKASYTGYGSQGGANVGGGCLSNVNSCWPNRTSKSDRATDGFRVSLYKFKDNNITKIGESYDFINDQTQVNNLKGDRGITFVSEKTGKLDYLSGSSFTVTSNNSSFGTNLYYLNFSKFLSNNVDLDVIKVLEDTKDSIVKEYQALINKYFDTNAKYYFVFEPLTIFIYKYNTQNRVYFYGTLYEHIRYLIGTNGNINTLNPKGGWVKKPLLGVLPVSLRVTANDTRNNIDFINFMNKNFPGKLANLQNNNHIYQRFEGINLYKPEIINSYAYGMYVVDSEGYIDLYKDEVCKTNITVDSCKKIGVSEPNSKVCVVGDGTYFYENYNETTSIYCSDSVQTSFDEFYTTFRKSIRAGSYFNMNPLKVTDTKTCYINNISNSASGWQNSINTSKNIGTIDLSIGNFSYKLIGATTSSNVTCNDETRYLC